ncbi:glucose-6-phosphate dehydrogenase assembly protein OpcA [Nakamurella flavida]|uniref:Glucose-6-phosphate dehydrogenase assembly protein OpcA n=1 Tax=Nakamurella flavida TaxID=363630 RepID=A0A938YI13_9ACTN|nr:glucose-6-phosphate dehydrogenase assembly protein OpcA [Nakamurella flavida]MBM9475113.1 glucose-6-phosphate dehydrogenase assembly protein OpcA [Nakamurella flavida]MDP9776683.1 glucose-6-phosphate dehydrogenase assembly protein OpcA [Nakamurella flavida]
MIIDLPSTTSSKINKAMVDLREKGGTVALGRVLTLVIVTDEGESEEPIEAANAASFEHPCRVIVVGRGSRRGAARMDAQIRVGGDAGASEVVVVRLYGQLADHGATVVVPLLLADAPVVVWWPGESPAVPAEDPIGSLAQRRITDGARTKRPLATLAALQDSYRPGDTDLTWTRLTSWRGLLAAALDQPPHEKVISAVVAGSPDSVSTDLMAAWLAVRLRCPVRRVRSGRSGSGLGSVVLTRKSGDTSLIRPDQLTATLSVPDQPRREVALRRRGLRDCIAEELRRLDPDDVFAEVLAKGLPMVAKHAEAAAKASTRAGTKSATPATAPVEAAADPATPKARGGRRRKTDAGLTTVPDGAPGNGPTLATDGDTHTADDLAGSARRAAEAGDSVAESGSTRSRTTARRGAGTAPRTRTPRAAVAATADAPTTAAPRKAASRRAAPAKTASTKPATRQSAGRKDAATESAPAPDATPTPARRARRTAR